MIILLRLPRAPGLGGVTLTSGWQHMTAEAPSETTGDRPLVLTEFPLPVERSQPPRPSTAVDASRLRVLHVTESLGGGVVTALQAYVRLTPQFEHVILAHRDNPYYRPNWLDDEVEFVELPAGSKVAQVRTVARTVRRMQPDVVHAHSSWAGLYVRALPLPRHRIVYTPHCFAFERTDVGPRAQRAFRVAEAALGPRTGHLLGNGRHEVELARRLRTVRWATSLLVTPFYDGGVPADRRIGGPRHRSGGTTVFATTGRAMPQKGVDFFLAVLAAWATSAPATDPVEWQWIGGGEPAAEQRLRDAGVVVSGWLPREEVVHRLRGADVYLHTAAWEAGYPLSLLEAGALDLPLVVRAITSLVDLPLPLAHSPEQAAAQLRNLLDEPTRASSAAATRSWIAELSGTSDRERLGNVYRAAAVRRG